MINSKNKLPYNSQEEFPPLPIHFEDCDLYVHKERVPTTTTTTRKKENSPEA